MQPKFRMSYAYSLQIRILSSARLPSLAKRDAMTILGAWQSMGQGMRKTKKKKKPSLQKV